MGTASFVTSNGLAPMGEPLAIPLSLDFSSKSEIRDDFVIEETSEHFGGIQSVFIDNADNAAALELRFDITGQRLKIPAGKQGVFPVYAVPGSTAFVAKTTSAANLRVALIFSNVPQPVAIW